MKSHLLITVAGPCRSCTGLPCYALAGTQNVRLAYHAGWMESMSEAYLTRSDDQTLFDRRHPVDRTIQTRPLKRRSDIESGAISTLQKDDGGACNAVRIAARITVGCVTAKVCPEASLLLIHFSTRAISCINVSPPWGEANGSVSHSASPSESPIWSSSIPFPLQLP